MAGLEVPRVAILASGSGTTAEYVIHATQTGVLQAEVGLVIHNNKSAGVVQQVRRLNAQYGLAIATRHISGGNEYKAVTGEVVETGGQTIAEAAAIAEECKPYDLVALLGYMKKVSGPLLDRELVVNTHPGPLPATEGCIGKKAQERVLELGLSYSAQTLHYVTGEYDRGEVIAEHRVPVMSWHENDPDALFDDVQMTEKSWVPRDLQTLLHG